MMAEKKSLEWYIQQATVKIEVGGKQGSGFFIANIPPKCYILTAYHCIGDDAVGDIVAKSPYCDKLALNVKKSIRGADIAVLEVVQDFRSDYCLPLGSLPKNATGSEVISVGYPVIDNARKSSVLKGIISNIEENQIFLHTVIKGEGQSGASIYHCATNRVVGIAKKLSKDGREGERAVNVDVLFDHWPEFEEFNSKLAKKWDSLIKQEAAEPVAIPEGEKPVTFPKIEGKLTLQKLQESGILEALSKLFVKEGSFNKEESVKILQELKFEVTENLNKSQTSIDFWRRVCRDIEHGKVPWNLNVLLRKIAQRYSDNPAFAQWR